MSFSGSESDAKCSPTSVQDKSSSSSASPQTKKAKIEPESSSSSASPETKKAKIEPQLDKIIKRGRFLPTFTKESLDLMFSSPEWVTHLNQIKQSQGYEVDVFPEFASCGPVPLRGPWLDDLVYYAKKAIESYNDSNNTNFELVQVVRAINHGVICKISFKAKAEGVEKDFQAKWYLQHGKKELNLVRLKPQPQPQPQKKEYQ